MKASAKHVHSAGRPFVSPLAGLKAPVGGFGPSSAASGPKHPLSRLGNFPRGLSDCSQRLSRLRVGPYVVDRPEENAPSPSPSSALSQASFPATVPCLWPEMAKLYPNHIALDDPHFSPPTSITYQALATQIQDFAAGLLELGLTQGEHVGLFSENSHRWLIADQGLQSIGCVPCVRGGPTAPSEELVYITGAGSNARALIVQDPATALKLKPYYSPGGPGYTNLSASIEGLEGGGPRFLVLLRDCGTCEGAGGERLVGVEPVKRFISEELNGLPVYTFDEVLVLSSASARLRAALALRDLAPDAPATISYTSGTTGHPKGVLLSQANLTYQTRTFPGLVEVSPGDRVLSMLPPWHIYERSACYFVLSRGATLTYTSVKRLAQDLPKGCDFLVTVPLVLDTLHQRIMTSIARSSPLKRLLAFTLIGASVAFVKAQRKLAGLDAPSALQGGPGLLGLLSAFLTALFLKPLQLLAQKLVFGKILAGLGIRKGVISGGGSLATHLDDFYEAAGLPVLNGWGLTETSPVVACRSSALNPRGTVGRPLEGSEVKVVDPEDLSRELPPGQKGLLLVRGPGVFERYYRDERRTEAAFRAGGSWYDTGDLGLVIPLSPSHRLGGCVVLTGRQKDTIVLRSGENVEPQPIEDAIAVSPLIKQAVVVGQDQRHLGALVVPDFEYLASLAEEQGRAEGFSRKEIEDKIHKEVDRLVRGMEGYVPHSHIQRVAVLGAPLSPEDGTLTRTMKVRRDAVAAKYKKEIEGLFRDGAGR